MKLGKLGRVLIYGLGSFLSFLTFLRFLTFLLFNNSPLEFESLESKTTKGTPVYNRIKFQTSRKQDVWMMEQSHDGLKLPHENWDQLKIVVDKTQSPFKVSYYQQGAIRANCLSCHVNGPRAIRPNRNLNSKTIKNSFYDQLNDQLKIELWNLRIKTYGKVTGNLINGKVLKRHPLLTRFLSRSLNLSSCTKCHSSSNFGLRNELKLENLHTVKFLVDKKIMPPFPFTISSDDLKKIKRMVHSL